MPGDSRPIDSGIVRLPSPRASPHKGVARPACDSRPPAPESLHRQGVRSSHLKGRFLNRSPRCFWLFGETSIVTNWDYEKLRQDLTRQLCFVAGPAKLTSSNSRRLKYSVQKRPNKSRVTSNQLVKWSDFWGNHRATD